MRVWGYTDNMESVRELRLSFDRKSLGDWLAPIWTRAKQEILS